MKNAAQHIKAVRRLNEFVLKLLVHPLHVAKRHDDVAFAICEIARRTRREIEANFPGEKVQLSCRVGHLQVAQVLMERSRLACLKQRGGPRLGGRGQRTVEDVTEALK